MKQKQLAEALGVSPSYLNEIESGKKPVTMEMLQMYAAYFRIPASSLLYFAERTEKCGESPKGRPIAVKALKMLDWVDTITREDEDKVST